MSPLLDDAGQRCPRCGALGRAGSDWCTLCYADLRPQPEPVPEPEPALVGLGQVEGYVPPVAAAPSPRGKHARRAESPGSETAAAEAGEDGASAAGPALDPAETELMLAQLAAESGPSNPFGGLANQLDSVGAKALVMVGGVVIVSGLLFLVMTLLGSLV